MSNKNLCWNKILIFFLSCTLIDLLLLFGPSFQLYIELAKHNKTLIYQNITICVCESYNNFIVEVSDIVLLTLIDKILASLWQPIVRCQHTHLETQNNYFVVIGGSTFPWFDTWNISWKSCRSMKMFYLWHTIGYIQIGVESMFKKKFQGKEFSN
jgi:hypothetical protein